MFVSFYPQETRQDKGITPLYEYHEAGIIDNHTKYCISWFDYLFQNAHWNKIGSGWSWEIWPLKEVLNQEDSRFWWINVLSGCGFITLTMSCYDIKLPVSVSLPYLWSFTVCYMIPVHVSWYSRKTLSRCWHLFLGCPSP